MLKQGFINLDDHTWTTQYYGGTQQLGAAHFPQPLVDIDGCFFTHLPSLAYLNLVQVDEENLLPECNFSLLKKATSSDSFARLACLAPPPIAIPNILSLFFLHVLTTTMTNTLYSSLWNILPATFCTSCKKVYTSEVIKETSVT